ncbi:MAG: formate dehydrogenase, partial [Proteobacteria bacterium]|nr:formate dehydrogenase [Pseudomonadota bacterium]
VCYCRECVFLTDVFSHDPEVFIRRAQKKGRVKMPTETTMFHMTRLAHMSHACVGCGQCSSACPSSIPVADIFETVATQTQDMFAYVPGRRIDEPIPYLVFEEP